MADIATKAAIAGASTVAAGGGIYGITELATREDDSVDTELFSKELDSVVGTKNEETSNSTLDTKGEAKPKKQNPTFAVAITYSKDDLPGKYNDKVLGWVRKSNLSLLVKSDEPKNEAWWKQSFNHKYKKEGEVKENLHDIFKGIEVGYSNKDSDKALNQACEKAYKEKRENFKENNYLIQNIGEYCNKYSESSDVTEPNPVVFSTDSVNDVYKWGILRVPSNRDKLVQNKNENEFWWIWAHNNLYKTKSGNKHSLFNNVNVGYSGNNVNSLNKSCEEAYKKSRKTLKDNNEARLLVNNINDFCSIGKTRQALKNPENWIKPDITRRDWFSPLSAGYNEETYKSGLSKSETNRTNLIHPTQGGDGAKNAWEWVYRNRFLQIDLEDREKLPAPFNRVTHAYESRTSKKQNSTALNWVCDETYLMETISRDLFNQVKVICFANPQNPRWDETVVKN